jgi:protein subunit release factor A
LTAAQVGIYGSIAPDVFQERDAHVTLRAEDISIEWLEPDEERGGAARISHGPTGIVVEANAYPSHNDNCRAALQVLALQLHDRERASQP